jgi:hypothetical protein
VRPLLALLPEVTEDGGLCHRCEDVVAQLDAVL